MRIDHFRYLFSRELDLFYITENIAICKKPFCIWDRETGDSVNFKTLDDVFKHKIGEETVKDIIERIEKPFTPTLNKGSGDSSPSSKSRKTFSFSHADGRGAKGDYIPPAVANTRIKSKSLEGALAEFKKNHLLANREFSYSVDEDGFVTGYNKGGKHSVQVPTHGKQGRGRKNMIIHNHPSGGAFSDTDLHTMAADRRASGVIASGKKYDYKFEKGTHFKAQEFSKAVSTAKMKGTDYDDAVDKWLRSNAKKYGYTYSRKSNTTAKTNSSKSSKKTSTKKASTKKTTSRSALVRQARSTAVMSKYAKAYNISVAEAKKRFDALASSNSDAALKRFIQRYSK